MNGIKFLRFLLFPFAFLYGIIVWFRHFLYNHGLKKSKKYHLPIICIGNLSVGGTGKTPMTEYLIRLLKNDKKIAVLSRGYKRRTKGFVLADSTSSAQTLGDEPYLYHRKYPEIQVVVNENRVEGVDKLLQHKPETQVVILDDAFQHRRIQAGFSVILTAYSNLYADDFFLPTGTLRDSKNRANKADCILVTKCPPTISEQEKEKIIRKIKPKKHQNVFFTTIKYAHFVYSAQKTEPLSTWIEQPFTLVVGIANPEPLITFLKQQKADFKEIIFPDHHNFSFSEIEKLKKEPRILTTEKDFVRLYPKLQNIYYLPIETSFISQEEKDLFNKKIKDFVS